MRSLFLQTVWIFPFCYHLMFSLYSRFFYSSGVTASLKSYGRSWRWTKMIPATADMPKYKLKSLCFRSFWSILAWLGGCRLQSKWLVIIEPDSVQNKERRKAVITIWIMWLKIKIIIISWITTLKFRKSKCKWSQFNFPNFLFPASSFTFNGKKISACLHYLKIEREIKIVVNWWCIFWFPSTGDNIDQQSITIEII